MGLIAGLKNIFKNTLEYGANDVGSVISKVANIGLTAIAHPVGFVTNTEKAYKTTEKESVGQLLVGGVSNTLMAVAPFTGAIKAGVVKAVTSAVVKAPIKTAAVALVGGGALVSSPTLAKKAVNVVASAPESLFKTGETVGKIVESGGNILTDLSNKDVKNIALATGAGAVLATGAVLAYDYVKDKVTETKAIQPAQDVVNQPNLITVKDLSAQTPDTPQTPATQPMSSVQTGSKTGKRRARKAKPQNISQIVRVNVINSSRSVGISQTKKYLNQRLFN